MSRTSSAIVAGVVTLAAAALLIPVMAWTRAHKTEQACRAKLRRLGSGLLVYRGSTKGGDRWPSNKYRGSDMLIRMYEEGVMTDPDALRCPASPDVAPAKVELGSGRMPTNGCSYAAWARRRPPGAPDAGTPLACDDDEGPGARFNHGDRLQVLFSDGHVETRYFDPELAPRLGKGQLEDLGN